MWVSVSLRFLLCLIVFVLEQTIYSVLSASTVGSILVQVRELFLMTISCLLLHTPSTCFGSRYRAPLERALSVPIGQKQTRGILQPCTLGTLLTAGSQRTGPAWSLLAVTLPSTRTVCVLAASPQQLFHAPVAQHCVLM